MNETNRKSGEPATADSDQEIKRLAALISENRAALDKGWEELARLTQLLASHGRLKPKDFPPENPPPPEATDMSATGSASVVIVKE